MRYRRFIYQLDENNNICDIYLEPVSDLFNYFMFVKDNQLVVNGCRTKITKQSILFDIEILNKYKEMKLGAFEIVKAFSPEFLKMLNQEYNITFNDLKGAIENGKNYRSARNFNNNPFKGSNQVSQGYVVGA